MSLNNVTRDRVKKKFSKQSRREADSFSFEIIDALYSPIITFNQFWADTIPQRIMQVIPQARLAALLQRTEEATDPEVVAYLYTRTLEAPMPDDWCDIYCYLSCKVLEEWFRENHWEEMCPSRKLNPDYERQLAQLRKWIYEKRKKGLNKRSKGSP